ncbi:substrate-binding periplasmic protein [Pseudoalteromonas sp. SSM20]|uniref:substrate-binding periplasmic protein n=1 Tax=Pseudoalteromonas sp. SSM20 TaxID=3139394 RepID=UPI003BAC0541
MLKTIIILAICFSTFSIRSKELSAGWELWYPYQYHNKNSELVGLDIDAFKAIMKQANLPFTIAEIPWKTHLHFIKTGKVDLAMGASKTAERAEYAYFSEPYREETVKLFVKKGSSDSIKLNKLADLIDSDYIIGVESGYYYGKEYEQLIKQYDFKENIIEAIDLEQNVSLFLKGHLDGLLVDPYTMYAFIKKYQLWDKFEAHPLPIYSADIVIMVSKKSSDESVVSKLNSAINQLKKSGYFSSLQSQWITPN